MVSSIRPLDESVVNKIAAGEIIISPMNALKEMMENSIDAGATALDILVRDGGMKLLQVTDNGSGINKEDMPLLCERFTTSKLTKFEDLESIATYGFRGEALASISHIARVTVTTKTVEDKCAWRVSYAEGRIIGEPKPVAGKDGTVILVEDLFYNMPSRLQALRSPSEEYAKILDVVGRYSVHCDHVAFSCKKFGDSQFSSTVRADSSTEERIRVVFGNAVARSLLHFEMKPLEELDITRVTGKVSNLDFTFKKSTTPVFFINNRLVTCNPLARALRQIYANHLPKGSKPFIYLSIQINPQVLDVNVHPTKREVRFLHQDEIIEKIAHELNDVLSNIDSSRSFKASTILTGKSLNSTQRTSSRASSAISKSSQPQIRGYALNAPTIVKRHENKLVRTDASQAKITTFLNPGQSQAASQQTAEEQILEYPELTDNKQPTGSAAEDTQVHSSQVAAHNDKALNYQNSAQERVDVNLSSVKRLREAVDNSAHRDLTDIFANLIFVGVVDPERRLASIQHDLKLFLVDYGAICYELFYQICLTDFANYGKIIVESESDDDLKLVNILSGFEHLTKDFALTIVQKLWDMREMLAEYFAIDFTAHTEAPNLEEIKLKSIPLLLKGYTPPFAKLPFFIYRLGTKVNWDNEEPCLDGIMRQISLLYIPEVIELVDTSNEDVLKEERIHFVTRSEEMSSALENVLFPCIKRRFLAPHNLLKDVIEIANLPGLYKVFERC